MKVNIGPYRSWIGPYQIADMVFFWIEKYPSDELERRWDYRLHDRFGDWLAHDKNGDDSRLARLCQWIQERKKRRIKIHIDNYDVWSMDHTLSLIILPMLTTLKEQKHGHGYVDDVDVPAELGIRSTDCAPVGPNGVWDDNSEHRFEWMLDELIWTFTQLCDDNDGEDQFFDHTESLKEKDFNLSMQKLKVDREGLDAHRERIERGIRLFGKYFRTLWD
jgi:hypothetical protein